jgi:hypothetical protein
VLEPHFISSAARDILLRDPFTSDDFEAFIAEWQRTIQQAIEELLIKERLDLLPRLRELDAAIEGIELGLRSVICEALGSNPAELPPHVLQKAEERIATAAKKSTNA